MVPTLRSIDLFSPLKDEAAHGIIIIYRSDCAANEHFNSGLKGEEVFEPMPRSWSVRWDRAAEACMATKQSHFR